MLADEIYTSSLHYFISPLKQREQEEKNKQQQQQQPEVEPEAEEEEEEAPERPPPPLSGGVHACILLYCSHSPPLAMFHYKFLTK